MRTLKESQKLDEGKQIKLTALTVILYGGKVYSFTAQDIEKEILISEDADSLKG
jgi:hypothetical protein